MGVVLKQYLDRFAAMEKKANETLSADPEALVGVDSLPGSEHDATVPEEAKKPDEEVAEGQPAGAASTSGAVAGGDAKPLEEGKLEVDEPLTNAEEKPLITDDALTAKEASAHLANLVSDLLKDIGTPVQEKSASCAKPANKKNNAQKSAADSKRKIVMDQEMLDKMAAAQAAYMAGREAAGKVTANGAELSSDAARRLIKDACVKAAQEAGLNPEDASIAADNAMSAAGMPAEAAAAADAAAGDAAAGDAAAAAADAQVPEDAAQAIPEDVTEEELANAIVDLVSSGELDAGTAKALVDEIAGEEGAAVPSEDQAAEIIAQGLESGEITPDQAQEIAAAIDSGDVGGGDAGGEAAAGDPEAQGAADAAEAIQDAHDEAQGEADAEEAMKQAAAQVRANTIQKVANHIIGKRAEKRAAAMPGGRIIQKVASILQNKKAAIDAKAAQQKQAAANSREAKYIAGFKKKAEEMGVDPTALARYVVANSKK